MKNSSKPLDIDLHDIDLLLQASVVRNKPEDTQDLQARITSNAFQTPQLAHVERQKLAGFVPKFSEWFSLPRAMSAGALAFALLLAVTVWIPGGKLASPSAQQVAQVNQTLKGNERGEEEIDFSVLSAQEVEMDVYEELLWEELLLAEDELVFAAL